MICSKEFSFFLQTLQKAGIGSQEFALPVQGEVEIDAGLRRQLGVEPSVFSACRAFFPHMEPDCLYHVVDRFYLHYLFFLLPEGPRGMVVGPYLSIRPSAQQIMETAERFNLSPARARLLEEFYPTLPYIADSSSFYAMAYCLCEALCGRQVQVQQLNLEDELAASGQPVPQREVDLPALIQRLENRYHLEDELMGAIAKGDRRKLRQLLDGSDFQVSVEPRLADPVRNLKNYCIILNTLCRKAAQSGGVHPVYLDDLSRTYAARIEELPTTGDAQALVLEMADHYCLLVQQHSLQGCSRPVQTAILYIRQHLAEPLNLHTLARMLDCNASYFSARFKKETGQTVTEYILQERMRLAGNLLATTQLQIQTVAQYCGFLDVNYFSRVFRQTAGCSPSEYRKTGQALQL